MTFLGWYHGKGHVQSIPKMWQFLRFRGFKPQLQAVKVWSNSEKKIGGEGAVKKTTLFNEQVLGAAIESAWVPYGWFHADSMAAPKTDPLKSVVFYGSLFLLTEPKFHSLLTLSSNNSRSKADTPNKFHIFGIVRTFSFTWFYPGYFFL